MNKDKFYAKLEHFWYYYKVHTIIAAIVLFVAYTLVSQMLTDVKPDYEIGLVSAEAVSDTALADLQSTVERFCEDLNGDGKVTVKLSYFHIDLSGQTASAGNYLDLSSLDGDLVGKYSGMFFLADTPSFWENTHALAYLDGGSPAEEATDFENMVLPFSQIPGLSGLGMDELNLGIRIDHPQEQQYRALLDRLRS